MSDGQKLLDWGAVGPLFIHPTKLLIIEAMQSIGHPLSASELEKVFGAELVLSNISYHLTTLAKHGVVQQMEKRKGLRAIKKTPFVLAPAFMK